MHSARRAVELDFAGLDSSPVWRQALRLEPRSAFLGVNLALSLERAGRHEEAERVLLGTEKVNHLWLPRWTLASFYLRAGRKEPALAWSRLALERSSAEVRPALFALIEEAGVPASEWLAWCGRNPEMISSALEYLSPRDRAQDLAAAARLLAAVGPGRAPEFWRDRLGQACERLIQVGQGPAAIEAWNALAGRNLLPYPAIGPSNLIGNPRFAATIDGYAFNWRYPALAGVSRALDPALGQARIAFDGTQPETSELLSAPVWLERGVPYRLTWSQRVESLDPAGSGPVWAIAGQESPPLAARPEWAEGAFEIAPLARPGVVRLSLSLVRKRGLVRAAGIVELRGLKLEALR